MGKKRFVLLVPALTNSSHDLDYLYPIEFFLFILDNLSSVLIDMNKPLFSAC